MLIPVHSPTVVGVKFLTPTNRGKRGAAGFVPANAFMLPLWSGHSSSLGAFWRVRNGS
jgi:hypothetical protein